MDMIAMGITVSAMVVVSAIIVSSFLSLRKYEKKTIKKRDKDMKELKKLWVDINSR